MLEKATNGAASGVGKADENSAAAITKTKKGAKGKGSGFADLFKAKMDAKKGEADAKISPKIDTKSDIKTESKSDVKADSKGVKAELKTPIKPGQVLDTSATDSKSIKGFKELKEAQNSKQVAPKESPKIAEKVGEKNEVKTAPKTAPKIESKTADAKKSLEIKQGEELAHALKNIESPKSKAEQKVTAPKDSKKVEAPQNKNAVSKNAPKIESETTQQIQPQGIAQHLNVETKESAPKPQAQHAVLTNKDAKQNAPRHQSIEPKPVAITKTNELPKTTADIKKLADEKNLNLTKLSVETTPGTKNENPKTPAKVEAKVDSKLDAKLDSKFPTKTEPKAQNLAAQNLAPKTTESKKDASPLAQALQSVGTKKQESAKADSKPAQNAQNTQNAQVTQNAQDTKNTQNAALPKNVKNPNSRVVATPNAEVKTADSKNTDTKTENKESKSPQTAQNAAQNPTPTAPKNEPSPLTSLLQTIKNPENEKAIQERAIERHVDNMNISKEQLKTDLKQNIKEKIAHPDALEVETSAENQVRAKLYDKLVKTKPTKSKKDEFSATNSATNTTPTARPNAPTAAVDSVTNAQNAQNAQNLQNIQSAQNEAANKDFVKTELVKEALKKDFLDEQKSAFDTESKSENARESAKESSVKLTAQEAREVRKQEFAFESARAKESVRTFAQRLSDEVRNYRPPVTRLSMELHPENLGALELTLTKQGKELVVSVVSNSSAIALFMANQGELKASLENAGLSNVNLNFESNDGGSQSGGSFGGDTSQQNSGQHRQEQGRAAYANLEAQTQEWNKNGFNEMKLTFPIVA